MAVKFGSTPKVRIVRRFADENNLSLKGRKKMRNNVQIIQPSQASNILPLQFEAVDGSRLSSASLTINEQVWLNGGSIPPLLIATLFSLSGKTQFIFHLYYPIIVSFTYGDDMTL